MSYGPGSGLGPVNGVTWSPLRNSVNNNYSLSGLVASSDANAGSVATELGYFARLPASKVLPMLGNWCAIWGSAAETGTIDSVEALGTLSGLTVPGGLQGRCLCVPEPSASPFTGLLVHEWHHAIDYTYGVPYGTALGRSAMTDIQNLWTRAQTFWAAAPQGGGGANGGTFYGWKNVLEFWAELGRTYWTGSGDGSLTPVTPYGGANGNDTSPDSTFRQMISGYGTTVDDSFIIQARSIIGSVLPLAPPRPS